MSRLQIILALAALCGVSFYLRSATVSTVLEQGYVNFVETDPWYHARSIEHLAANFPWPMTVDPYSRYGADNAPTPPFFDYGAALAAWIAGLGHPSQRQIDWIAAWYPVALSLLLVPVVFLLGERVFGTWAGLMSAAIVATLPGHFLQTGMVGYTDHHVMESLLSSLFFLLLLIAIEKPWPAMILAGMTLGAYLLTFHGGAFLVAIAFGFVLFEQIRSRWPRQDPGPSIRPIAAAFVVALIVVAPFYKTLWMNYSMAGLGGGAVVMIAIDWWSRRTKSQIVFFAGLLAPVAAALISLAILRPSEFGILKRLSPSFTGTSGDVAELQSILMRGGHFSIRPVWEQFGGAIVLALAGLWILGEMAIREPNPRRNLIFFWSFTTLFLTAGQIRMTYYSAITVALLCGFLAQRLWDLPSYLRWGAGVGIAVVVFAPNVILAAQTTPGESPDADWHEAMSWMRDHTPEPFGDAAYYNARFRPPVPLPDYSVMAWWDYGYWIMGIAHRVPVANPTQSGAVDAAAALLAQNEADAAAVLEKFHSRYVVVDSHMPMLADDENAGGKYPGLFSWNHDYSIDDFILTVRQRNANGGMSTRLLYLPAYFRSLLVRLWVYGGAGVEKPRGSAIAYLRGSGANRELVELREYPSEEEAIAAERSCRLDGCVLVSTNSMTSCVKLEPLARFHPVFNSGSEIARNSDMVARKAVQIYEFK